MTRAYNDRGRVHPETRRSGGFVILRLPEPGAAKQRNGGGRRRISSFPSCVESKRVAARVAHLEIVRPSYGVPRFALQRLGRLWMTGIPMPPTLLNFVLYFLRL